MEKPSLPKGTRDFGPQVMGKRLFILETIKAVFQKYGFMPLETPAMENLSVLTGKYGEEGDQLLYKILNSGDFLNKVLQDEWKDATSKELSFKIAEKGLRYDLTVPFARFVVMNRHELALPFKRFQIQPVWRADNPQKGRYREFYQCDADVVGTKSLVCETEIILMIKEVFGKLGLVDYTIKINHRGILSAIASLVGADGNEASLFTAIDKLDKIGQDGVLRELTSKGFSENDGKTLFELLHLSGNNYEKIESLSKKISSIEIGSRAIEDLNNILKLLVLYKSNDSHVEIDAALARGLSYYTGTIFEVKVNNVSIGSVSGGGRYDNLTQAFGSNESLTGIGISFGVDRIYDVLEALELFPKQATFSTSVLITHFDNDSFQYGLGVLATLRTVGISSEIYPDQAKIKKQLDYANRKSIPFVLVIGSDEMASGDLTIKNMTKGEQQKLPLEKVIELLKNPAE